MNYLEIKTREELEAEELAEELARREAKRLAYQPLVRSKSVARS